MRRNSVLEELRVSRLAVIQEETSGTSERNEERNDISKTFKVYILTHFRPKI